MLRVLLYGMVNAEVKYACSEMLDHLGLPYSEINDLGKLKDEGRVSDVLILPETSRIEKAEAKAVRESSCSLLFFGHDAEDVWQHLGCHSLRLDGGAPPKISGLFDVKGMGRVPFFYEFAVLADVEEKCERMAGIETEHGSFVGAVVGERDNRCVGLVVPQLFKSAAYLLAGSEATLPVEMQQSLGLCDAHGRIDGRKTEVYKQGFLRVPIVNFYEKFLLEILLEFSKKMGTPLVHKWFYPGNYDMALCPTHDVDYATSVFSGLNAISSLKAGKVEESISEGILGFTAVASILLSKLGIFKRNPLRLLPSHLASRLMKYNSLWNFEMYTNTEEKFEATSSYYFLLNRTGRDSDYDFENSMVREVMVLLTEHGCEIGLHGSFDSYTDVTALKEEKSRLEVASGKKVLGVRQHHLRINVPDTWRFQEAAGFVYDSTYGYTEDVGFRAGCCLPFMPWDFKEKRLLSILEIPLVVMDGTLFQKHYLKLSSEKALEICRELIDTTCKFNGTFTFNWHSSINRKRDRGWFDLYKKILNYSTNFNAWRVSGEKLADWWKNRLNVELHELSSSGHKMTLGIASPSAMQNFVLKIHLPKNMENLKAFLNEQPLDKLSLSKRGRCFSVCLNVRKGQNVLIINFES